MVRYLHKKTKEKGGHSASAKKVTAFLFLLLLILYAKYPPFSGEVFMMDTFWKRVLGSFSFVANQTLGIVHEGGHGVCYVLHCPEFITALNGTVFQWLFPALVGYYYKRKGNWLGFLIGLFFLGVSMLYTAWYMSTALEGPLVPASKSFLGVDGLHDFYQVFNTLGILQYSTIISSITKFLATTLMIGSTFAMLFHAFDERKV